MRRFTGALGLGIVLAVTAQGAAPPVKGAGRFTPAQQDWIENARAKLIDHVRAGRIAEAEKLAREDLALHLRVLGRDHWQTKGSAWTAEGWRRIVKLSAKGRGEMMRARELSGEASRLRGQGQFAEAEKLLRQAWTIMKGLVGEDHPDTITLANSLAEATEGQNRFDRAEGVRRRMRAVQREALGQRHPALAVSTTMLGYNLVRQGKIDEAQPLFEAALPVHLETPAEGHVWAVATYVGLATCQRHHGRFDQAEATLGKAIAIRRQTMGEDHPDTANLYFLLAAWLRDQGKHAQAQPLYERNLAVHLKEFGEDHADTAVAFTHLGNCHHQQGRFADAQPLFVKALAIRRKVLGEAHEATAEAYNNLASSLNEQGRHAQAQPLYEKALAIRRKLLGDDHPDAALCRLALAVGLLEQGKHARAEETLRKALAALEKSPRRDHPALGAAWHNLATCLRAQRKYAEAQPFAEKALAASRRLRGEDHPRTSVNYYSLAVCLYRQGRRNEAVRLFQQTLPSQEAGRSYTASTGFERAEATARQVSPHAILAVGLARLGQPENAFAHAERSLARGLLDDLALRKSREAVQTESLKARLAQLQRVEVSYAGRTDLNAAQRSLLAETVRERREITTRIGRIVADHSARQALPLGRIQRSLRAEDALVLWIDVEEMDERWGCVVRREGKPRWERLAGSGKGGAWTRADDELYESLYRALRDPASAGADRQKLTSAFVAQRFDPLRPHLEASGDLPEVRRLFVVPTGPMARVPAELLAGRLLVHYVPSGSVLARLAEEHRALDGKSLLALGDPVFDRAPPPEPPASGVLVLSVVPGGNAARAGLQSGDVLLSVGGVGIDGYDDLGEAEKQAPGPATVWRDGQRLKVKLPGSPLGATVDRRSARAAVRAWRRDAEAVAVRGSAPKRLPGTRLEAEAIASMVKGSTVLLGSDASEQRLDALRADGLLKKARILHLATHGESDEQLPGRSALLLAQDKLPDPLRQALEKKHVYDGRLTVSRIRADWDLDADLVVLSACETALGKDSRGDGLLGFAQAFLSRGARSVVLSRWKVDDAATALLMVRFYENLLGRREGLKQPMGRAAALDEAKRWLRSLPRKEAGLLNALLTGGELRGTVAKGKPARKPTNLPEGDRPYSHPFYWAAFTLVGDPD